MNLIEFQTAKGKAQPRGLGHSSEQTGRPMQPYGEACVDVDRCKIAYAVAVFAVAQKDCDVLDRIK